MSPDGSGEPDPDLDAIIRYRETGKQRHLADIYRRNQIPLQRRMAHQFHNSPVDPEELSHIALTKAFNRLDTFRGEAKFSTWLYRIAINAGHDLLRKHTQKQERDVGSLDNEEITSLDSNWLLADYTFDPANRDTDSVFADALRGLSERQRTILLETARGALPDELSERLGIPKGTIKSSLHRGREVVTHNITTEPEDMHPKPSYYFDRMGKRNEVQRAATQLSERHQETVRIATSNDNYPDVAREMNTTTRQARVRVLKAVDALTPLMFSPEQTGEALTLDLLDPIERLHLQLSQNDHAAPAEPDTGHQPDISSDDAPTL